LFSTSALADELGQGVFDLVAASAKNTLGNTAAATVIVQIERLLCGCMEIMKS
jgi:hypothetical protein